MFQRMVEKLTFTKGTGRFTAPASLLMEALRDFAGTDMNSEHAAGAEGVGFSKENPETRYRLIVSPFDLRAHATPIRRIFRGKEIPIQNAGLGGRLLFVD